MGKIQLAGVEGLFQIVPPDDFVDRNSHERMVLRRISVVDVLGPTCRSSGGERKESN